MNVVAGAELEPPRVSFPDGRQGSPGVFWPVPRFLLPVRLAWRQLWAERTRLVAAVAGVMFATLLVLMQLGFRAALFQTAVALPQAIQGQLFLINPLTEALFRYEPVPRVRAYQALAVPDVVAAAPIYLAQEPWRNPLTGTHRVIQLIGFDAKANAIAIPGLARLTDLLTQRDTVAFDSLSRPEFGPIPQLLAERGSLKAEIADREVTVVGTVKLGPSFDADGNVVMSQTTFRRLVPGNPEGDVALVALRLKDGADVVQVRKRLEALLPADVQVFTHPELMQREKRYWDKATPIGVIFAFGSLMGLMVGMVIVYQILFTDVSSHLRGYATLKALGFSHHYLQIVVIGEACILACLGYMPGLVVSGVLYRFVGRAAHMPLELTSIRCGVVFSMIVAMCVSAGLLAVRKLREADPAGVF